MTSTIRATEKLHDLGQSLWLDNITRDLLTSGTLRRYIEDFSITGLTSNPTIFYHAINNSHDYDDAIGQKMKAGKSSESLFFDATWADETAGLVARVAPEVPIHEIVAGDGDGQVSLRKLNRAVTKLPKALTGAQVSELNYRLKALANQQGQFPIPKGPMPKNVKMPRAPR